MQRERSLSRSAAVLAGALLWAVVGAVSAQAAPFVDVEYDLGNSSGTSTVTLPVFDQVTFPLTSDSFMGSQTIRYQSDSGSNIVGGPVSLVSFNLTVEAPVQTPNGLKISTSTLHLSIPSGLLPQGGGTKVGNIIDPQGYSGIFYVTGTVHCYTACFVAGLPQSTFTPIQPTGFTQELPTLETSYDGATHVVVGTTTANFTLDPGPPSDPDANPEQFIPVTAQTRLVGREVSRTPIPEPGTLMLLGAGLAGLGAVGGTGEAARRLRRRRG